MEETCILNGKNYSKNSPLSTIINVDLITLSGISLFYVLYDTL